MLKRALIMGDLQNDYFDKNQNNDKNDKTDNLDKI